MDSKLSWIIKKNELLHYTICCLEQGEFFLLKLLSNHDH